MKPSILPQMGHVSCVHVGGDNFARCHVCSSARGQIINGGFETGNPAGWSFAGQATAKDGPSALFQLMGSMPVFWTTLETERCSQARWKLALHLSTGTVTNIVLGVPTRGTVIFQDVAVSAGQQLVFDWNFMSDELNEDPVYNDYCFYSVVGNTSGVTNIFLLASRNSSTFPGDRASGV